MATQKIRTRFAPSPTGYMHVGNLRTALYAYLTAKHADGTFILRIEDTDRERQVDGAVEIIYKTLRETGLTWDEGPDIGGPVGPYVQSERMGMFREYAEQLVEQGDAYYCFCGKESAAEEHAAQKHERADCPCRSMAHEEAERRRAAGEPCVIRQKMPREGKTCFDDVVFGTIEVDNDTLDDQVLLKADGMPTYNFANVVDDHLMGITHVIRGSEYLASAPKYNLLYRAFGWDVPAYVHCPPVMKDAQNKLSKRNGDASYEDLVAQGYLTEAVLNYILLLGWSPKGEREIYSLPEMAEVFDYESINRSPAIFDTAKLRHINAEYIRAMTPEQFAAAAAPYLDAAVHVPCDRAVLCSVLQQRCEVLGDIPAQVDFIDALPDYALDLYNNKKMKTTPETALPMLEQILPVLEKLDDFSKDGIHAALFALIEQLGVKNGVALWPLRVALSGKPLTPGGGIELAAILGKNETLRRLRFALKQLGATE